MLLNSWGLLPPKQVPLLPGPPVESTNVSQGLESWEPGPLILPCLLSPLKAAPMEVPLIVSQYEFPVPLTPQVGEAAKPSLPFPTTLHSRKSGGRTLGEIHS